MSKMYNEILIKYKLLVLKKILKQEKHRREDYLSIRNWKLAEKENNKITSTKKAINKFKNFLK